jgi:hypothetical protein
MPTKISNTNTNINRININVPKQRNAKVTPKSVGTAERELQSLENQDRQYQYVSQAPSQFVNPSVFGFNTTPIQTPMQEPVDNLIIEQKDIPVAKSINIPQDLTVAYSQPEYNLNRHSDFEERLSKEDGFKPTQTFELDKQLKTRFIKNQTRPDINEMAKQIIKNRPKRGLRG